MITTPAFMALILKARKMAKEKIDTAYRLLAMGISWSQIMQATGLTEEELKPLQA